ncbi:MAG: tetratricopeptide repeat protein [Acidobacteriota bacterium]
MIKKTAPAKVIAKRNDSALKAKTAKAKETKAKVKAPAQSTTSAKPTPKPAVRVQSGKAIVKPKRKLALPNPVAPPPAPEPPRRSVTSGALRAFEHSVRVFNRRHFEEAKSLFEALLSKFPAEVELIARSQMYIQVCSQKMAQVQTTPRNADELYDHGVYALNIGDFTQAKTFFEKALRLKPNEAHLLYSLAATHAQTGSMDQALDYLKRTLQVQPRYRFQALNDTDFSGLRENKQFLELIGLASPFDLLQSRR